MRERAHRQLAGRRSSDALSTTALVYEAYLKLSGSAHQSYEDRIHFFAVASPAMRQILVDYARRHAAAKRGSGDRPLSLDPDVVPGPGRSEELLELDEALAKLERLDERLGRVVELRFFGGCPSRRWATRWASLPEPSSGTGGRRGPSSTRRSGGSRSRLTSDGGPDPTDPAVSR